MDTVAKYLILGNAAKQVRVRNFCCSQQAHVVARIDAKFLKGGGRIIPEKKLEASGEYGPCLRVSLFFCDNVCCRGLLSY